jgi:hypothetical protein
LCRFRGFNAGGRIARLVGDPRPVAFDDHCPRAESTFSRTDVQPFQEHISSCAAKAACLPFQYFPACCSRRHKPTIPTSRRANGSSLSLTRKQRERCSLSGWACFAAASAPAVREVNRNYSGRGKTLCIMNAGRAFSSRLCVHTVSWSPYNGHLRVEPPWWQPLAKLRLCATSGSSTK